MRGLSNRGIHRDIPVTLSRHAGVTAILSLQRVDRIEDCDVHNRHGPAGATWSKLFAEDTSVARRDRCVIETAGINRDGVPAVKRIQTFLRAAFLEVEILRAETRTEGVAKTVGASTSAGAEANDYNEGEGGGLFHLNFLADNWLTRLTFCLRESNRFRALIATIARVDVDLRGATF